MNAIEQQIVKLGLPVGEANAHTPLELMEPKIFEPFCCELIKEQLKDEGTVNIVTTGISGQSQFEADIFTHHRYCSQDIYSLYEMRRCEKFTTSQYLSIIDRFDEYRGEQHAKINEFRIFPDEKVLARLITEYEKQEALSKKLNMVHRPLDSGLIHGWLKDLRCPELLYRFCHESWVSLFYDEQILLNIKNYGLWGYSESSTWRSYMHPYRHINGDICTLQSDRVFIQVFLPSLKGSPLSCLIDFRNDHYNHVSLTVSQDDLLDSVFKGVGGPPEAGIGLQVLEGLHGGNYHCDVGNCHLVLTLNETQSLRETSNKFWTCYKLRMEEIDRICRTVDFSNGASLSDNAHPIFIPYWLQVRISASC